MIYDETANVYGVFFGPSIGNVSRRFEVVVRPAISVVVTRSEYTNYRVHAL